MSDIYGNGYGSSHDWRYDSTQIFGGEWATRYFCRHCARRFVHFYHTTPDIFEAMTKADHVTDACDPS